MCAVTVDGRALLASGGDDRTVRLWDPHSGEQLAVLEGHQGWVNAVCAVTVDGRALLASGGDDRTVRLWDPHRRAAAVLEGHQGGVNAVCAVTVDGRALLASGGDDGTVRLWDPPSRRAARRPGRPPGRGPCGVRGHGGRPGPARHRQRNGTVRLWDPRTGEQLAVLEGHDGWVEAVCAVTVDGRDLLASGDWRHGAAVGSAGR